jgi:hypothetical protein
MLGMVNTFLSMAIISTLVFAQPPYGLWSRPEGWSAQRNSYGGDILWGEMQSFGPINRDSRRLQTASDCGKSW